MTSTQDLADRALRQYREGHLSEAAQLYTQLLAREPNRAETLAALGGIAMRMDQPDEATEFFRRAVATDPMSPEYQCSLGLLLAPQGRREEAITALRHAVRLRPDYPIALRALADILQGNGETDEAITLYRRSLSLEPDDAEVCNDLGSALMSRRRSDEATELFRKALKLRPGFAKAHYNLACAAYAEGRFDEAIDGFCRVMSLDPPFVDAYQSCAKVLNQVGRLIEAQVVEQQARAVAGKKPGDLMMAIVDPRWRGYAGPWFNPTTTAWKAMYLPDERLTNLVELEKYAPLNAAAKRADLPTSDELFRLDGKRLPCWLEEDEQSADGSWLTAPDCYPAYYGLFQALAQKDRPTRMLEIGVRTGYVAAVFAKAMNGPAAYVGVDPNDYVHNGLELGGETLRLLRVANHQFEYFLIDGFSWNDRTQNSVALAGPFDIIHIDGDHTLPAKLIDLVLARRVSTPNSYVLLDDFGYHGCVREAVQRAVSLGMFRSFTSIPTFRGLALLQT